MVYDFDTVINRLPTSSLKGSYLKRISGVEDILPLWIADMDFASPPEIVEAMKERVAHPLYGYTLGSDGYYDELIKWVEGRHGWSGLQRDWICYAPGVVSGFNFAIQAYSHPGDKVVTQPPVSYVMKIAINNNGRQMA